MKIDYNKLMQQQISSFGKKPKLLLHCCCAPCSSAVIERLKEVFEITYFYYNPNTYPKQEYDLRKAEFNKLNVSVVDLGYNHDEFLNVVKGKEQEKEGGDRCKICIALRLDKTFEYAKKFKYDYVTTTLSISPHKNANFINQCGENLSKKYNINYLYADFKKQNGYLRSIEISKELGIYRQEYCGCEFSKQNEH